MLHDIIKTNLKQIHQILSASMHAFKLAAKLEHNEEYKAMFLTMAEARSKMVGDLERVFFDISYEDVSNNTINQANQFQVGLLESKELREELVLLNDSSIFRYHAIIDKTSFLTQLSATLKRHLDVLKCDTFILMKSDMKSNAS